MFYSLVASIMPFGSLGAPSPDASAYNPITSQMPDECKEHLQEHYDFFTPLSIEGFMDDWSEDHLSRLPTDDDEYSYHACFTDFTTMHQACRDTKVIEVALQNFWKSEGYFVGRFKLRQHFKSLHLAEYDSEDERQAILQEDWEKNEFDADDLQLTSSEFALMMASNDFEMEDILDIRDDVFEEYGWVDPDAGDTSINDNSDGTTPEEDAELDGEIDVDDIYDDETTYEDEEEEYEDDEDDIEELYEDVEEDEETVTEAAPVDAVPETEAATEAPEVEVEEETEAEVVETEAETEAPVVDDSEPGEEIDSAGFGGDESEPEGDGETEEDNDNDYTRLSIFRDEEDRASAGRLGVGLAAIVLSYIMA